MIRVEALTKTYGPLTVLDDVDLEVPAGRVTGLLGPAGAGKTTLLRIAVGLTEPTAGRVRIDGSPYRDLVNPGRRVGVLLDAAAQHRGRTAREVLALGARTMGLPRTRVEEVLAEVSLSDLEAARRVRDCSPVVRQRLGLAHALLGDPSVLLLDEPARGLEPADLHRLHELLAAHAARGGAVLLTSPLLHVVEPVADEMVVLGRGRVVARGDHRRLRAASGRHRTRVASLDDERLVRALRHAGLDADAGPGGVLVAAVPVDVGRVALAAGVVLVRLDAVGTGLEDLVGDPTAGAGLPTEVRA